MITDSTSRILKKGVVGIGTYSYGINPLIDKRGQVDLFGKVLQFSQVNVVDALSAMAVYLMGEANESTPILIGRNLPYLGFTTQKPYEQSSIAPEQDLFYPLLKNLVDFKK
ncbi:MAG: coenzyme F420-0:L-glutamate ligase [Candidatus Peribacteria bacterium]|nr:coenzyme F420-0:L-glutamate ligase [Candidatus Peribacteria bacterium]